MNCPKCRKPMQAASAEDIEVDQCPQCRGTWFDRDELRKAKDVSEPDLNWMDFEIWEHKDRFRLSAKARPCPKCDVDMVAIGYDDTQVEIDYCPKCEGVWLDAGEFEKIIGALNEEANTKSLSGYIVASLEEAAEVITGPESFFSEWKDFTTVMRLFEYRMLVKNPKLMDAIIRMPK
ncbi:MAG TPA: zf-TFIIB domain-containing protein [Planctomycetota bacterium]|nr:zf-TFIIB domain-containing protein [Planctomycetota bacterium]